MKIMVVGDSFCHSNSKKSWVNVLKTLLDCEIETFGQKGCSNYITYRQYINNNFKNYDICIVLKTNDNRIPIVNNENYLCNILDTATAKNISKCGEEYSNALSGFLKFYYDADYAEWVSHQSLKSIYDQKPNYQKIIWINSIKNNFINPVDNYSVSIDGNLIDVLLKEIHHQNIKDFEEYFKINPKEIGKINHLTPENNYNLAVFLKNVILDPNANKDLSKHNWTFN
jgi:hypothetical protein